MKDVFISGWCGFPELFGDFAADFEFVVPFITHSLQDVDEMLAEGGRNLYGWSTGSYLILDQQKRPAYENIVLVAPFLQFTQYTPKRVLERMIKKFAEFPAETIEEFMKNAKANHTPDYNPRLFHILLHGLRFLERTEIDEVAWDMADVTILHGTEDWIVNIEASRDIHFRYPCKLHEIKDAGHFIDPEILRSYKI